MKLEGIHHVTAITADAPGNVDFYARVLGLRLVKKTVNQDDPTVYHLFYADEEGSAGADITFFEYPGARRGLIRAGQVLLWWPPLGEPTNSYHVTAARRCGCSGAVSLYNADALGCGPHWLPARLRAVAARDHRLRLPQWRLPLRGTPQASNH